MTDDLPDNILEENLLAIEAGLSTDARERDRIRERIRKCFNGYSALGLPLISTNDHVTLTYEMLNERFKYGLAQIVSEILDLSAIQKTVLIGGQEKEMSTRYGEMIIGTLVDQANQGVIDLSGFHSYWAYKKQEVQRGLDIVGGELNLGQCSRTDKSIICTKCVCSYRNTIIINTRQILENQLMYIAGEAIGLFQENIDDEIAELRRSIIVPWIEANTCNEVLESDNKNGQCDLGSIQFEANTFELECDTAFICGHILAPYTDFSLLVNGSVYVEEGSVLEFGAPDKASNGDEGNRFHASGHGLSGGKGNTGQHGANVIISALSLLPPSGTTLRIISKGGDGGNGGVGGNGANGFDGISGKV
jgi:hypothetical protein